MWEAAEKNGMTVDLPSEEALAAALGARISIDLQQRLKAARVGIAGLGGLGSHIAVALVRSGVGILHLVDFDRVELSNLNRQAYRVSDLGRWKTEALAAQLREINPYVQLYLDTVQVTEENLAFLFAGDEIVCEAFDQPEQKAMLVNGLLSQRPALPLVAASGMAGYGSSNEIVTRRVMGHFYLCGDGHSDIAEGACLTAARVAICANHQANMVVRLLAGIETV